jgi:hypothetical protein
LSQPAEILGPIGGLAEHARQYAQDGLAIFPVKPDKSPWRSQYQATTDLDQIDAWWRQWPKALIGHRLPPDQIILDVDPRHGGDTTWLALRQATDMPRTRRHHSGRGDGGGHTWWRRPADRLTITHLDEWAREHGCGQAGDGDRWTCGIDILRHDHRYTILPPSPHPDTGRPYRWADHHDLHIQPQPLPQLLVDLLTDDRPTTPAAPPKPPDPDSILDWYSTHHRWGDLLERHGWVLVGGNGDEDRSRWRHPNATAAYSATIRHHCLFVYSPNTAFDPTSPGDVHGYTLARAWAVLEHGGNLTAAAKTARELRDGPQVPHIDLRALVAPTSGHTDPPEPDTSAANLPDVFWDSRPTLTAIRQAAWSRSRSADAVFAAVLARAVCTVGPTTVLPPIVGSAASLNLAIALVSPSGTGKSTAKAIAAELIDLDTRTDIIDDLPIGSGEGLIDAYFELVSEEDGDGKTHKVKRQTKTAVFAYLDEGQALSTMGARQGATLLPTLRSAWSGSTLGQANATEERKRVLSAHTYRLGVVVGFQPEHAIGLIDDAAGGTPQRFLFLSAIDPNIPDEPPPWPTIGWRPPPSSTQRTDMGVPERVADQIRSANLAQARGELTLDPLDSHAQLSRLKVAAGLAILDRRTDVNDEDWALAGYVMDTSSAVRTDIVNRAAHAAAERERAATAKLIRRGQAIDDATVNKTVERAARTIARHVHKWATDPDHGPCSVRCLRHAVRSTDRAQLSADLTEAIETAIAHAWIVDHGVQRGSYMPGPEHP